MTAFHDCAQVTLRRLAFATLIALATVGLLGCSERPSLISLRDDFETHRNQFAAVAASAETHGDLTVAPTYSSTPTGPVPAEARDRYKAFIRAIGAQQVSFDDGYIEVSVGSYGLAVSGIEWGYARPVQPPDVLLPWSEIDTPHDGFTYFALEEGWYAYVYRF